MIYVLFLWFFFLADLSYVVRKAAALLHQKKVIEKVGDTIIVKTLSTFRSYIVSFTLDEEFEEYTRGIDNRHVTVGMTFPPSGSAQSFYLQFILTHTTHLL